MKRAEKPMAAEPWETGLIGGPEKREITIVDYDENWPRQFEKHAAGIARALGPNALNIEHIGSTSVPGLAAKPVIDILVVVRNAADESVYLPQLEAAGYNLRVREPDWHNHRMFRTPQKDVHVHIYSHSCQEIERCLIFRDRLRRNLEDRIRYERRKRELAAQSWPAMDEYARAKTGIIEEIIAAAQRAGEASE
jgi:GrpB-like predicted nucleotidyltransferase (UPF0157 family)